MKRKLSGKFDLLNLFTILAMSIAVLTSAQTGAAHNGNVSLSGYGTATIDGVMNAGEWNSAGVAHFNANLNGGGVAPATVYVMNDGANLYVGLKVENLSAYNFYALNGAIRFDNDHDGIAETGDDVLYYNYENGVSSFYDVFRFSCGDGAVDCEYFEDYTGGTVDGASMTTFSDGTLFMEMSHPLDSTDDAHDFSLRAGDTVGFQLLVNLYDSYRTFGQTLFPNAGIKDVANYGDIIIAAPPSIPISIDIKPNDSNNSINPSAGGRVSVAVLTTGDFNAADVDVSTVRFGAKGTEAAVLHSSFADADADGDLDLILHFAVQKTGINCASTSAVLTGETLSGQRFSGSDAVRTVGCR